MNNIKLCTKLVCDIEGEFFIPSYQRGYRWGKEEVERLLNDIYDNGANNYCLQPVVVKRLGDKRYELVDGQQRLITLYLIYKYMHVLAPKFFKEPTFSFSFETHNDSLAFLNNINGIDLKKSEESINNWFMGQAYKTIENFRAEDQSVWYELKLHFDRTVKIIWYEVNDENEDSIALFTRLNIGKIPLTSAELVKAMFLSNLEDGKMSTARRQEIALQWDGIEKELNNEALWYFLTNDDFNSYPTKIELILNLMAGKTEEEKRKDVYSTFFHFDDLRKGTENLKEIWFDIHLTFLILKEWFEDRELYHKIGYLIASRYKSLKDIYIASKYITKKEFNEWLVKHISESIKLKDDKDIYSLRYNNEADRKMLMKLLLLFNVESVLQSDDETQRFPFNKLKFNSNKKKSDKIWTLEHIHAQQSDSLRTEKIWKEWLEMHIPSIEALRRIELVELVEEMKSAKDGSGLNKESFDKLHDKVIKELSMSQDEEYLHSIANLALLESSDNTALRNSTFDVKRTRIIELDKKGHYIPFCTKMVYLKYYTPSDDSQMHFWGPRDREAYTKEIKRVLKNYLVDSDISVESEDK